MADPPRDSNGLVTPHDDPDIGEDDELFRYIDPKNHLVECKNTGSKRLSSGAFSESRKDAPYRGMSVDIEQKMIEDAVDPKDRLPDSSWGIVRLNAGEMRSFKFKVGSDPIDPQNPQHGEVWGIGKGMRKKKVKKAIMENIRWEKKAQGVF